jgi:Zn finger protein HypA/HybF involved in hydrogenase expression
MFRSTGAQLGGAGSEWDVMQEIMPQISERRFTNEAKAVRLVLEHVGQGKILDPWFPFPQKECSFAFGKDRQTIPVGALLKLWEAGAPFVQECPECGSKAYAIAFSGLLTIGGARLVCPGCGTAFMHEIDGGLVGVARFLNESPISGTEFHPTAMILGSSFPSDGKKLLEAIGMKIEKDPLDEEEVFVYDGFFFEMEAPDLPQVLLGCWPSIMTINPELLPENWTRA